MRLSTDADRDETRALATIAAALAGGITVFDTAHAYGLDTADFGHNERLVASALRQARGTTLARLVTKGGMRRAETGWIADGRTRTILSDCEASLRALDGLPIDLYLLHAPDSRTPWQTSVRALRRLVDEGLVARVGVSNINRHQLEHAFELVDVTAVEVPLSPFDVRAVRGGVIELCERRGVAVIAYSPLGGPRRAPSLDRKQVLADIGAENSATAAEVALAWLLNLSPNIVPIAGARRPETATSAARAAHLELRSHDFDVLDKAFGLASPKRPARRRTAPTEAVVIMGIPGAGKSRLASEYLSRGHIRLNRDEAGGSLAELASALDVHLANGGGDVVLDNTYLTRAARSYVIEAARRHGAAARCIWLDTPLAQAQYNLVERLLDRFGSLPSPEELRRRSRAEQGLLTPTSQMRALRELEPPSPDEGFTDVARLEFSRAKAVDRTRPGLLVAANALTASGSNSLLTQLPTDCPCLAFDWNPDGSSALVDAAQAILSRAVAGPVEGGLCPHPGGPPICWCRPPLPGLPLDFMRRHGVDPARSVVVGISPAHRTLAATLGARYVEAI